LTKLLFIKDEYKSIRGATLFHRKNPMLSSGYKHIPRNWRMRHVMEYSAQ